MRELYFSQFHANPETAYLKKHSKFEKPLTDVEEEVYANFRKFNPKKQKCAYTSEDEKLLRKYTDEFKDKTQRGELLEHILASQCEESDWLGGNCNIAPSSEFDDVVNGIDMIAVFKNEDGKIVLLGIDATTTFPKERLEWKVDKIFKEIEGQRLGKLKYFSSEEHPEVGQSIEMVPKVIIKVDEFEIGRLCPMIKNMMAGKKGSSKALGEYKLQLKILKEIKDQLEVQLYYAVNIFLDTAEHSLDSGMKITKEQAKKIDEILAAYEKRDMDDLEAALAQGKEVLSLFDGFDTRIIYKLQDVFKIIENLAKEKGNTLDVDLQEINGDRDLKASLEIIKKDRFKKIIPSFVLH